MKNLYHIDCPVRLPDIWMYLQQIVNAQKSKQKEVVDMIQMAEDDVAQVNDMLSMLQDAKEVRIST